MDTSYWFTLYLFAARATQDPVEGVAAIPGLLAGAAVASGVVHLEPRAGHDCCENMGKLENLKGG